MMKLISYSESLRLLRRLTETLRGVPERVSVRGALRRVLCEPAYARRSNPPAAVSAMDGIAVSVRAASSLPVTLQEGQWQRVNTGEAVPAQFTAVVKIEDVRWDGEQPVLEKPVAHFQNIRREAEDFRGEDLLLPPGHQLEAPDLSLLLAAGVPDVAVNRRPVVTFLPTGTELVQDPVAAGPGRIPESNSAMIEGMVEEWGGVMKREAPVPDEKAALTEAIRQALPASDLLVLSAGTSMGTHDFTHDVLQQLGTVHFHGVAIHPARPVMLAQIGDVPVLGLPGYPSAAFLAATLYLQEIVCTLSGVQPRKRQEVYICAEEIPARKEDSFYRVQCFDVDGRIYVRRIPRGSSSVRALALMDGWMHVPVQAGIKKRDAVRVDLLQDRAAGTIAVRGSGHPFVEKLFDLFHAATPSRRILFWDAPLEDALEGIIERNTHIAILSTHAGMDLFPPFAERLQAWMLRYRLFSRTLGLLLRPGLNALFPGATLGVPEASAALWPEYVAQERLNPEEYRVIFGAGAGEQYAAALPSGEWDAVFADIGFLRPGGKSLGHIQEHVDLVVSEHHAESDPGIKKLIELAFSSEFEDWLGRRGAFDPASRGLI